jgi:hypothetical protein
MHFALHVNVTLKFRKMIGVRDQRVKELGLGFKN